MMDHGYFYTNSYVFYLLTKHFFIFFERKLLFLRLVGYFEIDFIINYFKAFEPGSKQSQKCLTGHAKKGARHHSMLLQPAGRGGNRFTVIDNLLRQKGFFQVFGLNLLEKIRMMFQVHG